MGNRKRTKPEGNGKASATGTEGDFSLISNEKLLALYNGLLTCRSIGGAQGTNGQAARMRGHEAALVGATIDLGAGDTVCSSEQGVLGGFSDGAAVQQRLLLDGSYELAASSNGKAKAGRNGHSPAGPGLAYTHGAIGTALANKTMVNRKVAVVFSHEENLEIMQDALHIAAVHGLPVVFVHHLEAPEKRGGEPERLKRKSPSRAKTPWFPNITVDRDDLVALYRVASEAISRARRGGGPTLIECRPYCLNSSADDPILNMEHYLRVKGIAIPN